MNERYCYSTDEEIFHGNFKTRDEAIEAGFDDNEDIQEIFTGVCKKKKASLYFDSSDLIETLNCCAYDNDFGFVEDDEIVVVSDHAKFSEKLEKLIDEYCDIPFYTVDDIKRHEKE